jgi:hypothetical protein
MESENVRELCQEIRQEDDQRRTGSLLAELRETLAIQYDEARLRIGELARRYHRHLEQ